MTARLAALWAAYTILVVGLAFAVSRVDRAVDEIREQNCFLAELELLAANLLVGDEGFDEPDRAQYDKLVFVGERFVELCG